MRLVHGVELNNNMTFSDLERIFDLVENNKQVMREYSSRLPGLLNGVKSYLKAHSELVYYNTQFVKILTNAKHPKKYIKKIPDFLKVLGMMDSKEKVKDPKQSIRNIITWLVINLSITPRQARTEITPNDASDIYREKEKEKITSLMNKIQVAHGKPDDYFKELRNKYDQLSRTEKIKLIKKDNKGKKVINLLKPFKKLILDGLTS